MGVPRRSPMVKPSQVADLRLTPVASIRRGVAIAGAAKWPESARTALAGVPRPGGTRAILAALRETGDNAPPPPSCSGVTFRSLRYRMQRLDIG